MVLVQVLQGARPVALLKVPCAHAPGHAASALAVPAEGTAVPAPSLSPQVADEHPATCSAATRRTKSTAVRPCIARRKSTCGNRWTSLTCQAFGVRVRRREATTSGSSYVGNSWKQRRDGAVGIKAGRRARSTKKSATLELFGAEEWVTMDWPRISEGRKRGEGTPFRCKRRRKVEKRRGTCVIDFSSSI